MGWCFGHSHLTRGRCSGHTRSVHPVASTDTGQGMENFIFLHKEISKEIYIILQESLHSFLLRFTLVLIPKSKDSISMKCSGFPDGKHGFTLQATLEV